MANYLKNEKIAGKKTAAKPKRDDSKFDTVDGTSKLTRADVSVEHNADMSRINTGQQTAMKNVSVNPDSVSLTDNVQVYSGNEIHVESSTAVDEAGRYLTSDEVKQEIYDNGSFDTAVNNAINNMAPQDISTDKGYAEHISQDDSQLSAENSRFNGSNVSYYKGPQGFGNSGNRDRVSGASVYHGQSQQQNVQAGTSIPAQPVAAPQGFSQPGQDNAQETGEEDGEPYPIRYSTDETHEQTHYASYNRSAHNIYDSTREADYEFNRYDTKEEAEERLRHESRDQGFEPVSFSGNTGHPASPSVNSDVHIIDRSAGVIENGKADKGLTKDSSADILVRDKEKRGVKAEVSKGSVNGVHASSGKKQTGHIKAAGNTAVQANIKARENGKKAEAGRAKVSDGSSLSAKGNKGYHINAKASVTDNVKAVEQSDKKGYSSKGLKARVISASVPGDNEHKGYHVSDTSVNTDGLSVINAETGTKAKMRGHGYDNIPDRRYDTIQADAPISKLRPGQISDGSVDIGSDEGGVYVNERGEMKKSDRDGRWTTKNRRTGGHPVAGAVVDSVKSQYDDADAVQGAREVRDEADKIATLTGMKAVTRAGIVNNATAGIYHSHVKSADKERVEKYIKDLGKGYVTGIDNSYGNAVKDLKNNIHILDNYFGRLGIDFTGWTARDFDKAIKKGVIKNKAGKDIRLSEIGGDGDGEKFKFLLQERAKCEKRKNALRSVGTWKDDVIGIAGSLYGNTDAAQGFRIARNVYKASKAAGAVGSHAVSGAVTGGMNVVSGVRRSINNIKLANANAHIKAAQKVGKDTTKWSVRANKLKSKNVAIKTVNAKRNVRVRNAIQHPIKTVSDPVGKELRRMNAKIYQKTIGKTKFAQKLAKMINKPGTVNKVGISGALGRAGLHVTAHRFNVFGVPVKIYSAVSQAATKLLLRVVAIFLVIIIATAPIVAILGFIGSIFPASGDSGVDAAAATMGPSNTASGRIWDNAKLAMQDKLNDIADDVPKFLTKESKALSKKGYDLGLGEDPQIVFAGFDFQGPMNEICKMNDGRETDEDGSSGSDSGSGSSSSGSSSSGSTSSTSSGHASSTTAEDAEKVSQELVDSKATASNGPLSGSGPNVLTKSMGRNKNSPSGEETYYNMDMANCVHTLDMHCKGKAEYGLSSTAHYWVRSDGVKMYGDKNGISYVLCAANLAIRPKGTIVKTSLGPGIVCDTGSFVATHPYNLDIAVDGTWSKQIGGAASGTVDTWGAGSGGTDLCAGGASDDGINASGYNFFRAILAMATTATENEDDPAHQDFYNKYCVHLIDNAYNYAKYYTCKKWEDDLNGTGTDDASADTNENIDPSAPGSSTGNSSSGSSSGSSSSGTDDTADTEETNEKLGPAFKLTQVDSGDDNGKGATYGVTFTFINSGLWGDYTVSGLDDDYADEDSEGSDAESPARAGKASQYDEKGTAVGMFDVEENKYEIKSPSGKKIKTTPGTDKYMHSIGGGLNRSEAYEQILPIMPDYNEWEGYKDEGEVGVANPKSGKFIFESGDMTSLVEASYELSDADLKEEGIYVSGIFDVNNMGDENGSGGSASDPLSQEEMDKISAETSTDNQQRNNAISAALKLIGTATYNMTGPGPNMHGVTYTSGRGKGHIENFPSDYGEWKSQSDCSGYVSYVLYKSGAKGFTARQAYNTSGLRDHGKSVSGGNVKPGDVIVKTNGNVNGHYDSHVVMYIGSTSYGKFTIVECTRRGGKSGPQIRGYKSIQDFWNQRGADYKYIRNYYGD